MRKPANCSNQSYDANYRSPVAPLGITTQGLRLAAMNWLQKAVPAPVTPFKASAQVVQILDQYFTDSRSTSTNTLLNPLLQGRRGAGPGRLYV